MTDDGTGEEQVWDTTDKYLERTLVRSDAALTDALRRSAEAGLPSISVTPSQGKLLFLLARTAAARTVLEIGLLGGYSTIWLARALPEDGRVTSLEREPEHARVAAENLRQAQVADKVDIRVGRALDTLPQLEAEGARFDLVFIDADKAGYTDYLQWSLRLAHPGTLIVADNVVKQGQVAQNSSDPDVEGVRRYLEAVGSSRRLDAVAIQTVGSKGYDGFALAVVRE